MTKHLVNGRGSTTDFCSFRWRSCLMGASGARETACASRRLVDATTGYQLWSQRFDRALTDIFAVQDDIVVAVASATREALQNKRVDPHHLLARVALWFEWNVNACDRHLRRALAIEPNHTGALMLAAILSTLRQQPEQAWLAADRATRVDPLGQETRTWLLAVA